MKNLFCIIAVCALLAGCATAPKTCAANKPGAVIRVGQPGQNLGYVKA